MEVVIFWVGFALVVGVAASRKGRSGIGWFLLACLLSPLLAGLLLLVMPKQGLAALPLDESGQPITPQTHVRCPDCRELVRSDARKCKHCGTALIPQ